MTSPQIRQIVSNGSSDLLNFVMWVLRSAELCLERIIATTFHLFSHFILQFDRTNHNMKAKNLPALGPETKIMEQLDVDVSPPVSAIHLNQFK